MATAATRKPGAKLRGQRRETAGITRVTVCGYKSIANETTIDIRPLTILAGANSSGKSSIMQPLLLMKQTVEAPYDTGGLKIDGPNVAFDYVDEMLSRLGGGQRVDELVFGLHLGSGMQSEHEFRRGSQVGLELGRVRIRGADRTMELRADMSSDEVRAQLPDPLVASLEEFAKERRGLADVAAIRFMAERVGVSYRVLAVLPDSEHATLSPPLTPPGPERDLARVIHVPGLRDNPSRSYGLMTAAGPGYAGLFDRYTAGVLLRWQEQKDSRLSELGGILRALGLTWKVAAERLSDTRVRLMVGRLPLARRGGAHDLVNIADVGLGTSQVLPVLVALLAAERGQLIYIEQPELHLHPRAQVALAEPLAAAARLGVRVVVETHSDLLLLAVQTLVATGRLPADDAVLHWFTRDGSGATVVTSASLDNAGAFVEACPEDFGDVRMSALRDYQRAATKAMGLG